MYKELVLPTDIKIEINALIRKYTTDPQVKSTIQVKKSPSRVLKLYYKEL